MYTTPVLAAAGVGRLCSGVPDHTSRLVHLSESRIAQKRVVVAKHEFLENMHRGGTSTRGVEGGSFPLGSCVDTCVCKPRAPVGRTDKEVLFLLVHAWIRVW